MSISLDYLEEKRAGLVAKKTEVQLRLSAEQATYDGAIQLIDHLIAVAEDTPEEFDSVYVGDYGSVDYNEYDVPDDILAEAEAWLDSDEAKAIAAEYDGEDWTHPEISPHEAEGLEDSGWAWYEDLKEDEEEEEVA